MTATDAGSEDRADLRPAESAAKLCMENSGYYALRFIECSFREGRIILRDEVPSYYHKQLAQESIRSTIQSSLIVNQIKVVP